MYTEDDLIPLSALQHILFCERQCVLIHVEQVWAENRDATVVFCNRLISKQSRTFDQMAQAALSGQQNYTYGLTKGCTTFGTCSGCLWAIEIFILD